MAQRTDEQTFMDTMNATRNVTGGVLLIAAMSVEVMGLRDFRMGRFYTRQSPIGMGLIWVNLVATPLAWASGLYTTFPILALMMFLLAGMTILRFLLHRQWGRRLVRTVLQWLCAFQEFVTGRIGWFPTERLSGFIMAWAPPRPPHNWFWGYSWLQRLIGRVVPGVRQWEDAETGEIKGMRPVSFQLFCEPPLIMLAAWMVLAIDVAAGIWLMVSAIGVAAVSMHRRKALLDYEAEIDDFFAEQEAEEEIVRQVAIRRKREAQEDADQDTPNIAKSA